MNDRLLIQDKIVPVSHHPDAPFNLAKISIPNYLGHLQDGPLDLPQAHTKILNLKKLTPPVVPLQQYHEIASQLNPYLDEANINQDLRTLKEIVYFSLNVRSPLDS